MKKKVSVFGKKLPVFVIALFAIGLVSAALIPYYGKIVGLASLEQGLVLDGKTSYLDDVVCNWNVFGGDTKVCSTYIKNKANNPITIKFDTIQEWWNTAWEDASNAVTTRHYSILELDNKNPSDWSRITIDDMEGTLLFELVSNEFNYEFEANGLTSGVEYSLIYYADQQNRFVNWGGDNPGNLIATATADSDGKISIKGSNNLIMNLPHEDDWNGQSDANYCASPDNYKMCRGAKIWLVPSTSYDSFNKKLIGWNPTTYLFETDLITYNDFNTEGEGLNAFPGKFKLYVESTFDPLAMPGDYKITTKVQPATA